MGVMLSYCRAQRSISDVRLYFVENKVVITKVIRPLDDHIISYISQYSHRHMKTFIKTLYLYYVNSVGLNEQKDVANSSSKLDFLMGND